MDIQRLSQYLDYPIQPPPPGVTPNFANPESNAYQMYITAGVCVPLMVVFAVMRLASKAHLGPHTVRADEILFLTGLLLCFAFIAMTIACCVGSAFGKHSWDVRLGAFTKPQLVITLLIEILLPLALCLVKVSVLMLYLQVFRVLKWMRIACYIGIALIAAFHLSFSVAFGTMCAPRTGTSQLDFLGALVSSSCDRTHILVMLQGVGSVLVDFFLLILPLPAIWGLQMPLARKLALLSMFMVGFCACASSIISLVFRAQYWVAGNDNTWLVVPLWVTTMAEVTAGIMICCMPTTAALFKSVQKPLRSWLSARLTSSNRSGLPIFGASNSRLKDSLESGRKDGHGDHAAWVDGRDHGYSMYRIDAPKPGVWKRTEVEVSRTT